MYRKSQLASGKSDESGMDDGQAPMHHGGVSSVGVEEWVSKTHKTIAGIKKGKKNVVFLAVVEFGHLIWYVVSVWGIDSIPFPSHTI